MLASITLENYALANHVDVNFQPGFNVITGETGAGKSLLLDALALSVGARADATKVRFGAEKAEVFVEFDIFEQQNTFATWFTEQGLEPSEQLLIRRQIHASGRSKAWLNGTPISLTELKKLGQRLVQMQSQHAQTELLKPAYMIAWLDNLADAKFGTLSKKDAMTHAWHTYHALHKKIAENTAQAQARKERMRLLEMQLDDITEISELNYDELEREHEELSNYDALMSQASMLLGHLEADDVSVSQLITQSIRLAEQQTHDSFSQVTEHLHNAAAEIDEAIAYMRDFADKPAPDAFKLQQLDQQLGQFHRLAKKYEVKPQALVTLSQTWADELIELQGLADEKNSQAQLDALYAEFMNTATALDNARKNASADICKQVISKLAPLALENARCEFEFTTLETPNAQGISSIQFLFSANKGMPLQPLQKQASGGELSRLALVMQVLNVQQQAQALLVFDEIDVGMSGGTAEILGKLMQDLGKHQQILTITHQAQVAAKANHHLFVTKEDVDEQTQSHIVSINQAERVQELARMSGGVEITESTLAHARSLLEGS